MAYELPEEKAMATTSSCDSCGMPIESGRYCGYCTDDSGALQSFEERFARMAAWQARRDPAASRQDIERQVRAFAPAPGAWFEANGERIKLLEAGVDDQVSGSPGEVLDDALTVACSDGSIRPLLVQRAGRSPMTPKELLRGFPISKGTILK